MDGDLPLQGQWNFDHDNRKKLPKNHKPVSPLVFDNDVVEVYDEISKTDIQNHRNLKPTRICLAHQQVTIIGLTRFFPRRMPAFVWLLSGCDDAQRMVAVPFATFVCDEP